MNECFVVFTKTTPATALQSFLLNGCEAVRALFRAKDWVLHASVAVRSAAPFVWLKRGNKALAGFGDEPLDWLVVIDADLHAKPSHIWQLIEVVQGERNVAMACASALQNMPDIFGRGPWSYYDSYALLDNHNWLGITGSLIPLRNLQDRALWMVGRPVPVQAAFGGIAVLPMTTVRSKCLRWDGSQGCEHWSFCLQAGVAGQVVACPLVTPLVLHDQPGRWSKKYVQRRKSELKQLWRQVIV